MSYIEWRGFNNHPKWVPLWSSMPGFSTDPDRRIVPRWRAFEDSTETGELASAAMRRHHEISVGTLLERKLADWRVHQDIGRAVDLVGASLAFSRVKYAIDAARFLSRDDLSVSTWTRNLALAVIERRTQPELFARVEASGVIETQIGIQRELLRVESADPIGWVELARLYAGVGLERKAEESIAVALHLANDNRFVLRCTSRLFVHTGHPDRAEMLLKGRNRTRHDPWLLAALIAVGNIQGRQVGADAGRRILRSEEFAPAHISELAAAVGTLEIEHGSIKSGKKLLRRALQDPTENSIAQVTWAERRFNLDVRPLNVRAARQFEADAWSAYGGGSWTECVRYSRLWQQDEVFSSRPGALGSFTAAVCLDDYAAGEAIARRGLRANPGDFLLLNNRAFCLMNLDKPREATPLLEKMKRLATTDDRRVIHGATYGLQLYRLGKTTAGKAEYRRVLEGAERIGSRRLVALVAAHFAIEEARSNGRDRVRLREDALARLRDAHQEAPEPALLRLDGKLREDGVAGGRT